MAITAALATAYAADAFRVRAAPGGGDDAFEKAKNIVLSGIGGSGDKKEEDDEVTRFIDAYGSQAAKLGFGGIMGLSSGYALKKVGKLAALLLGVGFISLQALAYGGYIKQIDWKKVEEKAAKVLDSDGSGAFDKEDVKAWWRQFKKVMQQQLPTNSGFAGGFALGFYFG